jgi:hypothetical protein
MAEEVPHPADAWWHHAKLKASAKQLWQWKMT